MTLIVHSEPSDSPGYTRVLLDGPVGRPHGGEAVLVSHPDHRNTLREDGKISHILHGQREFDVLTGSTVEFPDGTTAEV